MKGMAVWFFVSLLSSAVQTTTGFGYAIVALAILPLFVTDMPLLTAEISCIAVWVSVMNLVRRRDCINYRIIIPELVAFLLVQPLATSFSMKADFSVMTAILGAVLFLLSLFFFFNPKNLKIPARWYIGLVAGAISGLIGGLFAISGPPVAIYLLASSKSREEYIETLSFHFVLTSIFIVAIRLWSGALTASAVPSILSGIAGLAIGYYLGRILCTRIKDEMFTRYVCIFTGLSGLYYMISYFIG